jgi:hypothetical protein
MRYLTAILAAAALATAAPATAGAADTDTTSIGAYVVTITPAAIVTADTYGKGTIEPDTYGKG